MDLIKEEVNNLKPKTFADRFRQEIPHIMDLWEKSVRREVVASRSLQSMDLKNSLNDVLENLVNTLEFKKDLYGHEIKVARQHGKQRSLFPQYTLEQIISEYRFLRRAIFEIMDGDVSPKVRNAIIDAIEIGISESASEFTKQQFQLKEQFISMLAHDLRNPLSAIKANAQIIIRELEKIEKVKIAASRIDNTVDKIDNLIKDFLDSSRAQMGQLIPLEIQNCDLQILIKSIVDDLSLIYGNRFAIESDKFIQGYWDPLVLQRTIGNLLTNAIKYGAPKSPVKIKVTQKNSQVMIAIHNYGLAIPLSEQENLFDNFYRISKSQGERTIGWGIGLFLVKSAMIAHGGSVQVESSEKEGTTFTLILPMDCRSIEVRTRTSAKLLH